MKFSKSFGVVGLFAAAIFSLQILCTGCSSEPEKTEIDRTKNTKPSMVEEQGEDAEMPEVQQATSAAFE